jgi:hypothetical protein
MLLRVKYYQKLSMVIGLNYRQIQQESETNQDQLQTQLAKKMTQKKFVIKEYLAVYQHLLLLEKLHLTQNMRIYQRVKH